MLSFYKSFKGRAGRCRKKNLQAPGRKQFGCKLSKAYLYLYLDLGPVAYVFFVPFNTEKWERVLIECDF
jgi:hypothetical protein